MQKKKTIFVSYTTRDNKVDIYSLKILDGKLKKMNYSCYIDLLHNDSNNKQQRVFNELISSDYFMIFNSDHYYISPWTQKELSLARKLNKKIINVDYKNLSNIEILMENT